MERTFVAVKPDGVGRGLVGEVIARFERKGLRLVGLKMMQVPDGLARQHYAEHSEKPFFAGLVEFITSGPIVAQVWEGRNAVAVGRALLGSTDPAQSPPGTIRGDFGLTISCNIVHGSSSVADAEREVGLFFEDSELVGQPRPEEDWLYRGE